MHFKKTEQRDELQNHEYKNLEKEFEILLHLEQFHSDLEEQLSLLELETT